MLQFQPPGFGQKVVNTSLGFMVYYTQTTLPWLIPETVNLPELVFLHNFGGGASAYEWSKIYPAFATTHRILAPDLIGWGESAHPVRDYQISDYLRVLTEFIRQTCRSSVTVVASSLTAALIIQLAVQHPFLFQELFLVCPSGFNDFKQSAGRRLPLPVINTPILDNLIYAIGAENEIAVRNFLQRFLFAKPKRVSQEMVQAYLTSAQQENAKFAALSFLRGDLYFDLSPYIQQLTIPTVIFWGEQAQFTSINVGRNLAALNPNAIRDFHAIADAGVLPHLEVPEVMIGLLKRYL
ncbi:alpha/beta hydrolase [Aetokthonos hydrillicola Thurmond2011]|jgi:pimeloyl-ACP methyl ester carboxylesterase|uniref:Alpha/beta hydrolase n=1 Tax=Aetokthonos hydrillicola Thurmond2011 TaxID=2712845 RepID=A0AAP5M8Z7_9CYAN|nr:alpha/beta hydrolase [Aetokthonos hydrillicola]MBO3457527.1 alpha/beta hydrolase [Aetokthonos hydrillicola CCALA 1050]MBW4585948.1 alpha/beta hydrolase [Aetokthonos hydrillicola CCALA 1050]MDR9893824.1 alpha/beta hydrolase [Aetokthonos hydrillicola Thurmond2011]